MKNQVGAVGFGPGMRGAAETDVEQVDARDLNSLLVEQTVSCALFVIDHNGVILTWNRGAEVLFGWPADEVLRCHYRLLFTPEDRDASVPQQELSTATREGTVASERSYVCKDGERVWLSGHVAALHDDEGARRGFSVVMRDNAQAQGLRERARQSEERFRLISETLPDTAWTTTQDGSLDFMNARWSLYTGAPIEQALGMGWFAYLHPEDRQSTVEAWQRAMSTSKPYEVEHRFRLSDGSYRWFISRALPILGAEGSAIRWVGTSTDIHEQLLTSLRLAKREQQQAVVVELGRYALAGHKLSVLCQAAVARVNATLQSDYTKILSYHPKQDVLKLEASTGLTGSETTETVIDMQGTAAGRTVTTLQPLIIEDFKSTHYQRSELLQAHGIQSCLTAPIIGTGTTPYGVLVTGSTEPARFPPEDVTFLQAVANIISEALSRQVLEEERRKLELEHLLEEQLEQERRRVGRELHDGIRQQLVGVKMLATLLKKRMEQQGSPDVPLMQEFSDLLGEANTQVRELINGLVPPKIDAEYLVSALERAGRTIEQWYGVLCTVTAPPRLPLRDDEVANHLFHIAQEAMTNAAKHSRASQVDLVIRVTGGALTLQVHDDGVGLPSDFDKRGSHGVTNMRHRAELIGAEFGLFSTENEGTTLTCALALQ